MNVLLNCRKTFADSGVVFAAYTRINPESTELVIHPNKNSHKNSYIADYGNMNGCKNPLLLHNETFCPIFRTINKSAVKSSCFYFRFGL